MKNTRTIVIAVVGVIILILITWAVVAAKNTPAQTTGSNTQNNTQQGSSTQQTAGPQVQARDLTVGTGTEATPKSVVSVLYQGTLSDGTVFDSSSAHGNQPLEFQLGTDGIIPGFQIGINGMKVGGERVMAIPPALAYGSDPQTDKKTGKVVIPANSTIQFDVKLVNVQTLEQAEAALQAAQQAASSTGKATPTKK